MKTTPRRQTRLRHPCLRGPQFAPGAIRSGGHSGSQGVELVALRQVAPRLAAQRTDETPPCCRAPHGRPLNAGRVVAAVREANSPILQFHLHDNSHLGVSTTNHTQSATRGVRRLAGSPAAAARPGGTRRGRPLVRAVAAVKNPALAIPGRGRLVPHQLQHNPLPHTLCPHRSTPPTEGRIWNQLSDGALEAALRQRLSTSNLQPPA